MDYPPPWKVSKPPRDRQILVFAFASGTREHPKDAQPVRVVAEWDASNEFWRPVKVVTDRITGIELEIICWADIPSAPRSNDAMQETQQELEWRTEFERLGELLVYDNVKQGAIYNDEAKRQAAFKWLSDQARARRLREENSYRFSKWTLLAAVAAVLVGIVGVVVTLRH